MASHTGFSRASRSGWRAFPHARLSRLTFAAILVLSALLLLVRYAMTGSLMGGDAVYYYMNVRSIVIDHDLDFRNEYRHFHEEVSPFTGNRKIPAIPAANPVTDRLPNKYNLGSALLLIPFFVTAHLVALALQASGAIHQADGYGVIYQLAAGLGSLTYGWLALLAMHRLGNRMFSPVGVLAAVVAIWGATPLVYYMTMEPLMSHTFSAFAVALLMLFWLDRDTVAREGRAAERRPGRWFVLGILSGLAGIIRYQDALFAGLPLISGTIQAFRNPARFRASIILRGVTIAGFFLLGIALPLGVQLAANRYLYGSVLTTGYAGEAFSNRASPRLLATLFSPHSGLLLWSPILGIALAGLGMLTRRRQWLGILLWVGLVIQWYLVSSWHAPHQGDSFGNRMLLNCAVVFGMGLMAWLDTLRAWPRWHRASLLLFGAFILANAVLAGLYCFRIIGNPY